MLKKLNRITELTNIFNLQFVINTFFIEIALKL